MNNGAYMSQDPAVLGSKVEEVVRADLGLNSAVPFEVISGNGKTLDAGTMVADLATHVFGGKEAVLMTVCFDVQQPRPVCVQVGLNRQGVGSHIGSVLYSTKIAKPVSGEVSLEEPKMFGASKFVGDSAVADKLNANKDLLKRAGKFARTECPNFKLKAPRLFQVKPDNGGTLITATSLARSYALGLKVSLDVQEFIDLAGMIEASL
ncbi:MAG TPA: hypothetical protein VGI81_13215 [Tepidisphaeraceae bacterium]|jgi:hypothetical protein